MVGQYYHLDSLKVKLGQKVNIDTIIGFTGKTGQSTGVHLHFGWYPIEDIKVSYYSRRFRDVLAFNFEGEKMEITLLDPSLTLYVLKNSTSKGYPLRDSPYGKIVGYAKKGFYLKVKKITKNSIKGYKWCLVDTYDKENVYIQVDFNYMRFEI